MVEQSAVNPPRRIVGSNLFSLSCKVKFHVYILENERKDIYIGQTGNLAERLKQHNDPNCRLTLHTKRRPGPWHLIFSEEFSTRSEAMKRERELKSGKGRDWIRANLKTPRQPISLEKQFDGSTTPQ
jgi:putative endonuclease